MENLPEINEKTVASSDHQLKLSNAFIEGVIKGGLEASDKKLLNLIAHKVLRNPTDVVLLDISEIVDVGVSDKKHVYDEIKPILRRLMNLEFVYDNEEEEHFEIFRLSAHSIYKRGVITFYLSKPFMDVAMSMDKGYTRYLLENIKGLRSIYSVRLYELLRQYAGIGWRKFTVEELRKLLNCEKIYARYCSFNHYVLKPAMKEIEEKTDINVHFREHRRKWKTREIEFFIQDKNAPAKPRQENLPGELDQMRLDVERFELELRRAGWTGGDFEKWLGNCGGYEACKKLWDDVLKSDIARQVELGRVSNPGAVIRRLMLNAEKYAKAWLEKKQDLTEKQNKTHTPPERPLKHPKNLEWEKEYTAWADQTLKLPDDELVGLVRRLDLTQRFGITAEDIRSAIREAPDAACLYLKT